MYSSNLTLDDTEPCEPRDAESPPKKKLKRSPKSKALQFRTRLEKEMAKNVWKARENAGKKSSSPYRAKC